MVWWTVYCRPHAHLQCVSFDVLRLIIKYLPARETDQPVVGLINEVPMFSQHAWQFSTYGLDEREGSEASRVKQACVPEKR